MSRKKPTERGWLRYSRAKGLPHRSQKTAWCCHGNSSLGIRETSHRHPQALQKAENHKESLLVEMEVSVLYISERLGHEDIQTTLETYAHLYPHKNEQIMNRLNAICA